MTNLKSRISMQASAIGSYLGVGFNDPMTQLGIDLGEIPNEFDDEAMDRMNLGNAMEDAMLNYFEQKLNIIIGHRNTEVVDVYDGLLRVKVDGITMYEGERTLVEAKYSNATSGSFVNNPGYILQCQAGMLAHDCSQALLLGMYNGKPDLKLIRRNEEVLNDIEEVTMAVTAILLGADDKENYPWHLVEKYSGKGEVKFDSFDYNEDIDLAKEYVENKQTIKETESRNKEIAAYFKDKYNEVKEKFTDDKISVNIRNQGGRSSFDKQALAVDYPEIDLDKYNKKSADIKVVDIRATK